MPPLERQQEQGTCRRGARVLQGVPAELPEDVQHGGILSFQELTV
jgi:hypothetical protein